jgi:hypothetical protein
MSVLDAWIEVRYCQHSAIFQECRKDGGPRRSPVYGGVLRYGVRSWNRGFSRTSRSIHNSNPFQCGFCGANSVSTNNIQSSLSRRSCMYLSARAHALD